MAIPKRTASLAEKPARKAGRRTSAQWEEWATEIKALRKEKAGHTYTYENVDKPAAIAQGLKKYYGIDAGSRDVDPDTKVGTLIITNYELEDDVDDSYTDAAE